MDPNQPNVAHAWDLITFIRFQAFPFTPDELKLQVCKRITTINIYRPEFHKIIDGMLGRNAFCEFDRFIRRYRRWNPGYLNPQQKDLETLMEIFWAEPNEGIARRLMRAFMIFPIVSDELRTIWNVAINILYSKTCHDDTVAALTLLESYEARVVADMAGFSDSDYIVIERVVPPPVPELPTSAPVLAPIPVPATVPKNDEGTDGRDVGSSETPQRANAIDKDFDTAEAFLANL